MNNIKHKVGLLKKIYYRISHKVRDDAIIFEGGRTSKEKPLTD